MRVGVLGRHLALAAPLAARLERDGHRVVRIDAAKRSDPDEERSRGLALGDNLAGDLDGILGADPLDAAVLFPWLDPLRAQRRVDLPAAMVTAAEQVARAGAQRVVFWGNSAAYAAVAAGARPLRESDPLAQQGPGQPWAEIDRALAAWSRGRSERLSLLVFRACAVVGEVAESPISELVAMRLTPRLEANTPLQLLAAEDAVDLIVAALSSGVPGIYNAAADGLVGHSEWVRGLAKVPVRLPMPFWAALMRVRRALGGEALGPRALRLLAAANVVDNARMKTHLGFRPRFAGREALARHLARI